MVVKRGYKRSEAGVIPEDWDVRQIGDLKPFVTSGSRGWAAFYSEYGSPFIRITNLSRTCIYPDLRDLRFVNLAANESEAARTQLRDGDILLSITADIGIVGHVTHRLPKPAYINQHIALVRFDSDQINSGFISYFLASENPQRRFRALTDSGAKAGMNLTTVQQIPIALPPTRIEQEAIADALSDADALIESLEQLLAKRRHVKQGAMQRLLTGKERLPGFGEAGWSGTELGLLPSNWQVTTIGLIAQVKTGPFGSSLHERDYVADGTPIITVEHLGENGIVHSNGPMVSEADRRRLKAYSLMQGDIVFSRVGAIDRNALVTAAEEGWLFSGRLLRLRASSSVVDPKYLSYQFHSEPFKLRVRTVAVGQTMASLNTEILRGVLVALPPRPEQAAIADILCDMDAEIGALEAKLAKARQIKQGMMQELLTGRIRLV
ncbi:MAG: restriction endonuclease subunit S [Thermoanaerobaculia bacterium]